MRIFGNYGGNIFAYFFYGNGRDLAPGEARGVGTDNKEVVLKLTIGISGFPP
jgi:hypothetical protein